jgi:hypothetical protein
MKKYSLDHEKEYMLQAWVRDSQNFTIYTFFYFTLLPISTRSGAAAIFFLGVGVYK